MAQGQQGGRFDSELLTSRSFCVHLSDAGGESLSCYSCVELTGFFRSALDALAYFRFVEIPRILDIDTGTHAEAVSHVADFYLSEYEPEKREQIDHLLGRLDRALIFGVVSAQELCTIREEFNAAFSTTNPEIQILTWGYVREILTSQFFSEAFDDDIAEEADENEKPSTELKQLLDSGNFDPNNSGNLALARDFLDRNMTG